MKKIRSAREIYPFKDRIVVERIELEDNEKFNNIFVTSAGEKDDKLRFGRVLAIGSGVTEINVDSYVLFNKWSGSELVIENASSKMIVVLMKEVDVVAIVKEEEKI